jgi:predicted oxidoreductase
MADDADVIVVGGGLAGLVAATEIADAGKRVILLDQEGEQSLGGQAFWSFGGLFLVNSPEQRRLGIKDSYDLALQDWMGTAGFDREEDLWPRKWAEAYVGFAAGDKRDWLRAMGHRIFRWSAGPSAAAMTRWAMAIRCRAFTSPGAPAPALSSRSSAARARRRRAANSSSNSAIASMRSV